MPPIDIDEEVSSSGEENGIAFRGAKSPKADQEEAEQDDESGDEYVVERILKHRWNKGTMEYTYLVKWQGFEDKADQTWEPLDNLATASEILEEYFTSIGGEPSPPPPASTKRGPKSGSKKRPLDESTPDTKPTGGAGRGRKKQNKGEEDSDSAVVDVPVKQKYPPVNDWDKYITTVRTIEEKINKMGIKDRWGMVGWENGQITRHRLALLHEKAPQSMLRFYESNLVFRATDPETDNNGEVIDVED